MRNVLVALGLSSVLILAACGKKEEAAPEAAPAAEAAPEAAPAEAAPAEPAPAPEAAPAQ